MQGIIVIYCQIFIFLITNYNFYKNTLTAMVIKIDYILRILINLNNIYMVKVKKIIKRQN